MTVEPPWGAFTHEHADVLGVNVSSVNMELAIDLAQRWISTGKSGYICMTGVHGVMEAQSDPELLRILNRALINAPDGMPMSWIGWLQGYKNMDRVYGPDFMAQMCAHSIGRDYRHFLCGGKPGVAAALRCALQRRFPGLRIVGAYTPPFERLTHEQENNLMRHVREANPHIVWVGLSTPKQEHFMAEYLHKLRVPLLVGVGAAFDVHTGRIRDAPLWVKRAGMQWLHRLIQDPKRLSRRYLTNNPAFVRRIILRMLSAEMQKHSKWLFKTTNS